MTSTTSTDTTTRERAMTTMSTVVTRLGRRGRVAARDRLRARPWSPEAIQIVVVSALLLAAGLVMSFSASVVDAAEGGDAFYILRRQVAWAAIGIPLFLFVSNLDHRTWRRLSWAAMVVSIVGLVAVIAGAGVTRGGATRWIGFGPFVVQPSELAKLATLLWLADVLARKARDTQPRHTVNHLLVPAVPVLLLQGALIMLQPDLGTTVLLALIVGAVLFHEGLPLRHFVLSGVLAAGAIAALAAAAPYRVARITGWLNPELDPTGTGYQLLQSMYALGSGGWFGLGLGSSRGKWNYVPNPETDFVFAIIGEELGLVGALAVLALFVALLLVGMRVARMATDDFGRTVAFGITAWLSLQAVINVGTVVGLLPITGMTLPLVSAGGSSLVATLVALGILVSVARDAGGTMVPAVPTKERRR